LSEEEVDVDAAAAEEAAGAAAGAAGAEVEAVELSVAGLKELSPVLVLSPDEDFGLALP